MKLSDKVTVPEQVLARQVGDETVMLDLANGTYFGLDPVGARIWQLLREGRTLEEVCEAMAGEYEVTRDDIERDVMSLVEELANRGLIVPA
ncbi:MAG: PqqD family protein [Burkholderiales bacterium]|nr:PqqD family protein [Burkholderiales bacterium]